MLPGGRRACGEDSRPCE